jgi:hypothetical protein
MFVHTWNKYLPVIKILLKRSVTADQKLDMNRSDFERAAGGKKVKFSFSIELVKGRLKGFETPPPLAKDLVAAMEQDDTANAFMRQSELGLSMNSNFQLSIKNTTPAAEPQEQIEEELTATEREDPDNE